jgi:hypothetical protein
MDLFRTAGSIPPRCIDPARWKGTSDGARCAPLIEITMGGAQMANKNL